MNFIKLTTLMLLFIANNAHSSLPKKVIEGDICKIEINTRITTSNSYKNLYVEFDQASNEGLFAYSTIFGMQETHYQSLFVQNENINYDKYPYDLKGQISNNVYEIVFYTLRAINGETMNGYRHETLTFSFNSQKEITSLEAEYAIRWPFPRNLTSDETIIKMCQF